MPPNNLPATIEDKPPFPVEALIAEPVVTDKEFEDAMARLGHQTVNAKQIRSLASCGVFLRSVGVLSTMRGKAMVNQHRFEILLEGIVTEFEKVLKSSQDKGRVGKMERLAKAMAILGSKLTESQRLMVEMQPGAAPGMPPVDDSQPVNQSFAPGQKISRGAQTLITGNEIHVHKAP